MTDDARPFIDHIVAHPDDDAPRLVFADWLDERGDPRGEFVRVQVERAGLPAWDARQVRLGLREERLLREHGDGWRAELPRTQGVGWGDFRRGFVAEASFANYATLREHGEACWAATPLEALTVRWPGQPAAVETLPPFLGLREVSVTGTLVDRNDVARLAAAPLLSTVRVLTVRDCGLGLDGFRRLVASPHLGKLTALRVPHNGIGNGCVGALVRAALPALEELDLSDRELGRGGRYAEDGTIDGAGLRALAVWRGLARVRSLTLSGNTVGREGLRALVRSPHAANLKSLTVRGASLDGGAIDEFTSARPELRLDALDLGDNTVRDLGAAYLARSACLRELKVLTVDRCEMTAAGARELAKTAFLRTLRRLNADHNSFGPDGLQALFDKAPPELHTLQLVANDLGQLDGVGVVRLAESPASDALASLDLRHNGLGETAARALARSPHLRNLVSLRLENNPIDERAARALLRRRLAALGIDVDSIDAPDDEDPPF